MAKHQQETKSLSWIEIINNWLSTTKSLYLFQGKNTERWNLLKELPTMINNRYH